MFYRRYLAIWTLRMVCLWRRISKTQVVSWFLGCVK